MATIANKLSHIVISKAQAGLMALAVVKYLVGKQKIDETEVVLYKQTLVTGFWHLSASQQLGVLEELHLGLAVATDKFVKSVIRDLIPELSKNHAKCMTEAVKDREEFSGKFYDFAFDADDALDISEFEYCIVAGASGKLAYVEAKSRAEEGFVEFEFIKSTKRYLVIDTNIYEEAEALDRMRAFKLMRTRARTVYVLLLKSDTYLFFRHKEAAQPA